MKLVKKKEFFDNGIYTNKYYFCGIRFLKKIWTDSSSETFLFKIRINKHNNQELHNVFLKKFEFSKKPIMLWFDHALGGGTETYSLRQFEQLQNKYFILRIQYFPALKKFIVYSPNLGINTNFATETLNELYDFLIKFDISEIVVNNLVGYKNSLDVLKMITKIKKTKQIKVSYRGHDFQSICPQFNLLNCDGEYCNLNYKKGCEKCWKNIRLGNNASEHLILRSGATTISEWRKSFGNFFENTLDEMVVFSDIIRDIFIRTYPVLKNKIIVIPHTVKKYPLVNVPKHNGINIACLGNMIPNKGAAIIRQMCEILKSDKKYKDVKLFIIGNLSDNNKKIPDNLHITGKYNPDDLPNIIEKNEIDVIFIPSIWPETFSYTTSEAMSMGLPVACFNLGAPMERVSKYKRGLIVSKIDAKTALDEITTFIKKG